MADDRPSAIDTLDLMRQERETVGESVESVKQREMGIERPEADAVPVSDTVVDEPVVAPDETEVVAPEAPVSPPSPFDVHEFTPTIRTITREEDLPDLPPTDGDYNVWERLTESWGAGYDNQSSLKTAKNLWENGYFDYDPSYNLENIDELLADIPPAFRDEIRDDLVDAKSAKHAEVLVGRFKEELKNNITIGKHGWAGILGSLGGAVFEEGNLVVAASTYGLGALWVAGRTAVTGANTLRKMSKMGTIAKYAAIAGAEEAALEGFRVYGRTTGDLSDVALAGLLGATMGAGISGAAIGLAGRKAGRLGNELNDRITQQSQDLVSEADVAAQAAAKTGDVPSLPVERVEEALTGAVERLDRSPDAPIRGSEGVSRAEADARVAYIETKTAELDVQANELAARVAADVDEPLAALAKKDIPTPEAHRVFDLVDDIDDAIKFAKSVSSGTVKLSGVEKTKAMSEFGAEKRDLLRAFQEMNPDAYKTIVGQSKNPPLNQFEKMLPAIKKAVKAERTKFAKAQQAADLEVQKVDADIEGLKTQGARMARELEELQAAREALRAEREAISTMDFEDEPLRSVGAGEAEGGMRTFSRVTDDELEGMYSLADGRWHLIRRDLFSRVDRSPNQAARKLVSQLAKDPVPKKGHAVNPMSAEELSEMNFERIMGPYRAQTNAAFSEWMEENGHNMLGEWFANNANRLRDDFDIEVSRAREAGGYSESKAIQKALQATDDAYRKGLDVGIDAKLPGSEGLQHDKTYVNRVYDDVKIADLNSGKYSMIKGEGETRSETTLGEMFRRAMLEGNERYMNPRTADEIRESLPANLEGKEATDRVKEILENDKVWRKRVEKDTLRISNAIAHKLENKAHGMNLGFNDLGKLTREDLHELMENAGLDAERIDDFFSNFMHRSEPMKGDAGKVDPLRHRMLLEVDHKPIRVNKEVDGIVEEAEITLRNILEERSGALVHSYVSQMAGWGALNKTTGGKIHNTTTAARALDDVWRHEIDFVEDAKGLLGGRRGQGVLGVRKDYEVLGGQKYSGKAGQEISYLDKFIKSAIRQPLARRQGGLEAGSHRALGGAAHMNMMGQISIIQASESSKALTEVGFKSAMQSSKFYSGLIGKLSTGKPLTEMEEVFALSQMNQFGVGGNFISGKVPNKFDTNLDGEVYRGSAETRIEMARETGRRANQVINVPMQVVMDVQEKWVAASMQFEMGKIAKGKKLSKADLKRKAWDGLSERDMTLIGEQIRKHGRDKFGKNFGASDETLVYDLGLDDWDNTMLRDRVRVGVRRRVRKVIQSNDTGDLPAIATEHMGALAMQFRIFPAVAWSKQLLHEVAYGDLQMAATLAANGVSAATFYAMQRYLKSIGRSDAEEYRKKYLSVKAIAQAAITRHAATSLAPAAVDFVSNMLGYGNILSQYRATGLDGSFIDGVPAYSLIKQAGKLFADTVPKAIRGEEDWQTAFYQLYKLAPYQSVPGYQNLMQKLLMPED